MKHLKSSLKKLIPQDRLYHIERPLLGLTGGIATGKSTVSKLLRSRGVKVIDADDLVKKIYTLDEVRTHIKNNYPEAWIEEKINFSKLRELFFKDPDVKIDLETRIYAHLPLVFKQAAEEIKDQDFLIYDVPLLFEKGLEKKIDLSIVVYAPRDIQLFRLLKRDGSKEEVANMILDQQMNIEEKKLKADFVLTNTGTLTELEAEVENLLLQVLS